MLNRKAIIVQIAVLWFCYGVHVGRGAWGRHERIFPLYNVKWEGDTPHFSKRTMLLIPPLPTSTLDPSVVFPI